MISLQRSMHSSQMYTPGPAMSFLTCFWLFPQKEHFSRSPPSPMRATGGHPPIRPKWGSPAGVRQVEQVEPALGRYPVPTPDGGTDTDLHRPRVHGLGEDRGPLARLEHRVDQAVLDGRLRGEDLVALDVAADLFDGLAGVVADHLLEQLAHAQDLVRLDLDVGGLAERALGVGLVDEDAAVGQREALAGRA